MDHFSKALESIFINKSFYFGFKKKVNKMKKIFAVFVGLLFLFSVISVAEGKNVVEGNKGVDSAQSAVNAGAAEESPSPETPEKLPAKVKIKKRKIPKKQFEEARERFLAARERYLQARLKYRQALKKFRDSKKELAACNDTESEKCKQLREQIREDAKTFLNNIIDKLVATLEKLKARVEGSEFISEERAAEILEDIEEKLSELETLKSELEGATTKEEIISVAKKLRELWKELKPRLKWNVGRLIHGRIRAILVRMERLKTRFERIIERLKEKGYDLSEAEDLVEQFDEKLNEAEELYEKVKEKYAEAVAPGEFGEIAKEINGYIKEINKKLKEARTLVRDIIKKIKEKKEGKEELEKETEEEEAEEEEEH